MATTSAGSGALVDDRYRIMERLDDGGMADVHRAVDTHTGDQVALKLWRSEVAGAADRARSEVAVLDSLDHPAIVGLRDHGDHDGRPYVVMDLVEGRTLARMLAAGALLDEHTLAALATQVAGALAAAHAQGIVHRDVKPSNIVCGPANRHTLLDFGISRALDATALTSTGMIIGTARYLAPEQVRGDEVGPPADLYALGLVLMEASSGRPAFPGPEHEAVGARLARPPDVPPEVPARLRPLVRDLVAMDPARRPTAAEVVARLDRAGDPAATGPAAESTATMDRTAFLPPPDPFEVTTAPGHERRAPPALSAVARRWRDLFPGDDPSRVVLVAGALLVALLLVVALWPSDPDPAPTGGPGAATEAPPAGAEATADPGAGAETPDGAGGGALPPDLEAGFDRLEDALP